MRLREYNKKRDFDFTNEPEGKIKNVKAKRFVIQFHQARRDHYDFRLENKGVLVSWAIPKGLSCSHKDKRLAIKVEDHPLDYMNFEGIILKGQYGAGQVEIWDKGAYECFPALDKGLKDGNFKVALVGKNLHGVWAFVKMEGDNWLAIYEKEQNQKKPLKEKLIKNPFNKIDPKPALLADKIPSGKEWAFEIKYDGYRIVAFIEKGKVKLTSRKGNDYTNKFKSVTESLSNHFKNKTLVADGEVVVFDKDGRSDFALLQSAIKKGESNFNYVIFDLLSFEGKDLRAETYLSRRNLLQQVCKSPPENISLSSYVVGKGKQSFALAKKLGLEGVVAKKIDSVYDSQRDENWLKIKCYKEQEFVIGGFEASDKNPDLSALLVGFYKGGQLIFAGKVGTGFNLETRSLLRKKLDKLKSAKSYFENKKESKVAVFVKPKLVAQVRFAQITPDGNVRQGSFVGLRDDKKAQEVVLE